MAWQPEMHAADIQWHLPYPFSTEDYFPLNFNRPREQVSFRWTPQALEEETFQIMATCTLAGVLSFLFGPSHSSFALALSSIHAGEFSDPNLSSLAHLRTASSLSAHIPPVPACQPWQLRPSPDPRQPRELFHPMCYNHSLSNEVWAPAQGRPPFQVCSRLGYAPSALQYSLEFSLNFYS